jgi:Uma2 family endonuclease
MAQTPTRTMTADALLAMPSGRGERYELIEGELIVTAAAGGEHEIVIANFSAELGAFLKEHPIGHLVAPETGFYTRADDKTVCAPDLALIRNELIPPDGVPDGYLAIVPDLVVQVVSPNDRAAEVDAKVQGWPTFGVKEVWVAYPATQRIMVYWQGTDNALILTSGDTLTGGEVLPGFEREVAPFFAV